MNEQNPREESIVSLDRLLAYHRRSIAYTYTDHTGTRTFSQEKLPNRTESNLPEDIMRNLWAFFDSHYFKEITQNELEILNCIDQSEANVSSLQSYDDGFQEAMEELFTPEYLSRKSDGGIQDQLQKNWREEMLINWNFMMEDSEASQQAYHLFQEQREAIRGGSLSEMARKEQQLFQTVATHALSESKHPLEKELTEVLASNSKSIDSILSNIHKQANLKNESLKEDNSFLENAEIDELNPTLTVAKRQRERQILLSYFKYEIACLEKKQVAECITKVKAKRTTPEGNLYEVSFEEGMRIKNIEMGEEELKELNQLRETSLFQFYQAGWKGPYNYICHNYLGFNILFSHSEEQSHLLASNSLLQYISESKMEKLPQEAEKAFTELEACHECRLLYKKNILSQCSHTTPNKQDLTLPTFYDPYIYFLIKNDHKAGEMAAELWQSSLLSNPFHTGGGCECKRYFCKMCIKDDTCAKCRYCQGVCTCSRCTRNLTIIRFKTIYALLGGDIIRLEQESYFSKFFRRQVKKREVRERNDETKKEAKYLTLMSYKMQLEEMKLMAHMVMRREIIKEELFLNEEAIIQEKIKALEPQ